MVSHILKRVGGKAHSAERIIRQFPRYTTFVDVCGGAGHILLALPYRPGTREVYNDLENNLYAFFCSMRDHAEEMQARLEQELPFRQQYYNWYRSLYDGTELTQLERASRYFYVLRFSGTGWLRLNQQGRASVTGWHDRQENAKAYYSAITLFQMVQERLRAAPCTIDNRDVLATIRRYDGPETLFYLDPPYLGSSLEYYEVNRKKPFPHGELSQLLHIIKGKVALSAYPHPDMRYWYQDWYCVQWKQVKNSDINQEAPQEATEQLYCNYPPPAPAASLWDKEETL